MRPTPFVRRSRSQPSLNVAPLLDVVFLLLIFFLLTSTLVNSYMDLDLPDARSVEARAPAPLTVSLDSSGRLLLNGQPTSMERLAEDLGPLLARDPERSVNLEGDEGVLLGDFVRVLDILRIAGVQNLLMAAEVPAPRPAAMESSGAGEP